MRTAALERTINRRRPPGQAAPAIGERCALCAVDLAGEHPHMLDIRLQRLVCSCRACALLFVDSAAAEGRFRLIPDRRQRVNGLRPADLGVPVGLAFFTVTGSGQVLAHYPSPAGATRWEVERAAWDRAASGKPGIDDLEPEVEALLVNTVDGRSEAWIVPISDCYRLVGMIRQQWQGLSGGDRVWEEVDGFFINLRSSHGKDTGR